MGFYPNQLPVTVKKLFQKGVISNVLLVKIAIQENIKDENKLTDIIFYLNHPKLKGRPIRKDEKKLISEWYKHRALVRQVKAGFGGLFGNSDDRCECPHDFIDVLSWSWGETNSSTSSTFE